MRLPIRWSRESSRVGMTSFPLGNGSFAFGGGIVVVVRGDDGGAAFVVAGVEDNADDVADPVGRFAGAEIVEDENFDGAYRFEDAHLGGFTGGVVAGLDFFQKLAVIAEEAGVSAANQIF